MDILILETSSEKGLLMLAREDRPVATLFLEGGPLLSKTLALQIETLLQGKKPEWIGVGTGPGSYTGIRVGGTLAKALSYGWKIPLSGFCSLKAFGPAPVLVDARRGGFYALLEQEPLLLSPEDPRLAELAEIRSPHPEAIQKRLLGSKALLIEANPDPDLLARLVWAQISAKTNLPLELHYLSHP